MDKTGTITKGNFKVQDVIPLGNATRHEILSLAASCEESSTHPIGKSIMEAAKDENVTYKTPENAKEIAGHGSVITIDNSEILAGNKKLMAQYHVTGDYPETTSYGTEVFLAKDGVLIGAIVIADTLKDDAKSAIASLKAQNLHTVMLTGDSETTANAIDKKKLKIGDSGLPKMVIDQTPWYMKWAKLPIVKAKIGPKVVTMIADEKVFLQLPLRTEAKVVISGLYITEIKSVRGGIPPLPKKKKFFDRFKKNTEEAAKKEASKSKKNK